MLDKSDYGDLDHFMQFGEGRTLSVEDKLKICVNVGIAIRDMHSNSRKP